MPGLDAFSRGDEILELQGVDGGGWVRGGGTNEGKAWVSPRASFPGAAPTRPIPSPECGCPEVCMGGKRCPLCCTRTLSPSCCCDDRGLWRDRFLGSEICWVLFTFFVRFP